MANSQQHAAIGAALGAVLLGGIELFRQSSRANADPHYNPDWDGVIGKTLLGAIGGSIAGLLPDILEPATSPFHRQFFHSLTVAGLLTVTGGKIIVSETIDPELKELLLTLIGTYGSHLVLDARTPMGLPFI